MRSDGKGTKPLGRRSFLNSAVLGAGMASLGIPRPVLAASAQVSTARGASYFLSLATLRDYDVRKAGTYDRTGANQDFVKIEPGATATLVDIKGPGFGTHLWYGIICDEDLYLKKLVMRIYWDGEKEPSVETPLGDFFGLGLGELFHYQSALLSVAPYSGLNSYFPMPFEKSAVLTITNEGKTRADTWAYLDYVSLQEPLEGVGYFHAQYRQQAPCRGWTDGWKSDYEPQIEGKKNLDGKGNYVFLEAEGRGHFVGLTQAVLQNQDDWYGEGDEMIFIDGSELPVINGTGTEDYFGGSWDYKGPNGPAQPFAYQAIGTPYIVNNEKVGGRYCSYRWHLEAPIPFRKSIKVSIEHGHANHRSDNFYTVAYWYQTEPHAKFPELPKAADRTPQVFAVGGPGAAPAPR